MELTIYNDAPVNLRSIMRTHLSLYFCEFLSLLCINISSQTKDPTTSGHLGANVKSLILAVIV